jgi:hypothetical protein
MVDRRELRCYGHLIRMDSNRKPRQVWATIVQGIAGKRKAKDRIGTAYAEADGEKDNTLQQATTPAKDSKAHRIC